jgi:hypothetical protein
MWQQPNQYLEALIEPRPRRHLRNAMDLWRKAGRVLIVQRPRLNTKHVMAVRMSEKVLGDVWWPVVVNATVGEEEDVEKILVLWLNSTLGFLLLLGLREETQGAWAQFKKPVLGAMPVLDVRQLLPQQRQSLVEAYDRLATARLRPFPAIDNDRTRTAIDHVITTTLQVPDARILRRLLAREPILCQTIDGLSGLQ